MKCIKEKNIKKEAVEGRKGWSVKPYMSIGIPDTEKKGEIRIDHQMLILAPNGEDLYHYHNKTRDLFTVAKGSAGLLLNDEKIILEAGDTALVQPGDKHKLYNPTDATAIVIETRLNVVEGDWFPA